MIRRDRLAKSGSSIRAVIFETYSTLNKALPTMLKDLDRRMEKWGTSGQFDPFDDIYNVRAPINTMAG